MTTQTSQDDDDIDDDGNRDRVDEFFFIRISLSQQIVSPECLRCLNTFSLNSPNHQRAQTLMRITNTMKMTMAIRLVYFFPHTEQQTSSSNGSLQHVAARLRAHRHPLARYCNTHKPDLSFPGIYYSLYWYI